MIAALIIIAIAFYWMLRETDYLTVRLESAEYQRATLKTQAEGKAKLNPIDTPYYWKSPEDKEQHLIICRNNWRCPYHSKCKKSERWTGWKLPVKTIKAFYSTLNLAEGCNIARAYLLKDIAREHKRKVQTIKVAPLQTSFIEQVRIGSHHEYIKWNHETQEEEYSTKPKKGYYHKVVEDYTTRYNDCLPGKEWLKQHEHDLKDYEPSIELTANGKALSVNGNYKHGMIKDFVKANR